jgi:hypothetical protein
VAAVLEVSGETTRSLVLACHPRDRSHHGNKVTMAVNKTTMATRLSPPPAAGEYRGAGGRRGGTAALSIDGLGFSTVLASWLYVKPARDKTCLGVVGSRERGLPDGAAAATNNPEPPPPATISSVASSPSRAPSSIPRARKPRAQSPARRPELNPRVPVHGALDEVHELGHHLWVEPLIAEPVVEVAHRGVPALRGSPRQVGLQQRLGGPQHHRCGRVHGRELRERGVDRVACSPVVDAEARRLLLRVAQGAPEREEQEGGDEQREHDRLMAPFPLHLVSTYRATAS